MSDLVTVLIADDHPLFRAGVRQVVEETGRHRVIAEVSDGEAALAQLDILKPDFALFDLAMPKLTGFEALERLTVGETPTRIIVVSMHAARGYAERARELGAVGFIAKEDAASELVRALDQPPGGFFMSQSVGAAAAASQLSVAAPGEEDDAERLALLSAAERRVLTLLTEGQTSKMIARALGISPRTVQAHRRNAAAKLEISGPNRLLEFAVRHRDRLNGD